ncbi:Hypothetical protein PHPALM_14188 [Phytophthora palmivora]|uniref:ABC Superfamily n=1 Tax=Phytophthora palmivora TaxID=4796 RepID=A0A2P4XVD4_9STRA|nr:Hypothetical protein PHPALM_14188 [Phytophthora palmivora]
MPRKATTHDASAPSKYMNARSKTANAKSKAKATPRKEDRKAASKAASTPVADAAAQGSRSRSLSPDDRPNPRFAYRDHSPGAESPVFDIPMITGSGSDENTTGFTKDKTPAQDAPSQDTPVDDSVAFEAKAAPKSSPARNLTFGKGKARKHATPGSPTLEPPIAKGYRSLFDSESDEAEEEEDAITEPQQISNDLDERQDRYQAAQPQGAPEVASCALPTPMYPSGYYTPDAGYGSPIFLEHLKPLVV